MSIRENDDTFIDDADAGQPRIVVTIDGGVTLTDGERLIRNEMIKPFLDDSALTVRNFYVAREQLGERR
jgi:hypothetical protein